MIGDVRRKAKDYSGQVPRALARLGDTEADRRANPPLLCNSVPKSGTHLLSQILGSLPGVRDYGTFLASIPSVPYRVRSEGTTLRRIRRFVSGELIRAHLFHEDAYALELASRRTCHFLVYRDPRDVLLSETHYLTDMNRWHRMHRHFRDLPDTDARIRFAILGDRERITGLWWPDLSERFRTYTDWLNRHDVCPVRFEDLVGPNQRTEVGRIVGYWLDQRGADDGLDAEALTERAVQAIAPERSHTFRKGRAGAWREELTPEHVALVKEVAGDLLIKLGYEEDRGWS